MTWEDDIVIRSGTNKGWSPKWNDRYNVAGFVGSLTRDAANRFEVVPGPSTRTAIIRLRSLGALLIHHAVAPNGRETFGLTGHAASEANALARFCDMSVSMRRQGEETATIRRYARGLATMFEQPTDNGARIYVAACVLAKESGATSNKLDCCERPWWHRDKHPKDDLTLAFEAAIDANQIDFAHTLFDRAPTLRGVYTLTRLE